jgi:3D (Asp-Asp-Asp) domain-containing protein
MSIARSGFLKVAVTVLAIAGFVALYEATMLDTHVAAPRVDMSQVRPHPAPGARLDFEATAYCKGQTTAAGTAVQAGMAAADPGLLPLGSVVEIDSQDDRYDGIYSILDTGPAIQGAIVDIYMWSCYEALDFGRQSIAVTVLRLGWNPRDTAPGFMDRLFRRLEVPVMPTPAPVPEPASPPTQATQ